MRWADLRERALPQELAVELEAQKAACARILEARERLIASLAEEIKVKDEEYVKGLQQQRADVDALLQRMAAQFTELRDMYSDKLAGVEASFVAEREAMLATNKAEVEALFDARRRAEAKFADDKLVREERSATEAYAMQAADLENFQKLKVKLETDISILEQQLEHMKFIYLLNTEKLEYNYRVLTERDNENKAALAAQKARLERLRASLAKVQADYEANDHKYNLRNEALTKEYQRATKSYRELQAKFRNFEAADAARYAAVCAVHEAEITSMAHRLSTADKVITEQLLGMPWAPASAGGGGGGGGGAGGSVGPSHARAAEGPGSSGAEAGHLQTHHLHQMQLLQEGSDAGGGFGEGSEIGGDEGGGGGSGADPRMLQPLLRLLLAECGPFLGDVATRELCASLDAEGKGEQAQVLRANSLLKAVGCAGAADVASLTQHFEAAIADAGGGKAPPPRRAGGGGKESDDDDDAPVVFSLALTRGDGTPVLPPSFSVLRTLRAWIEARKAAAEAAGGGGGGSADEALARLGEAEARGGEGEGAGATAASGGGGGKRDKRDLSQWRRMVEGAVPPARIRVWHALERGMQRYQKVLFKRASLISDCDQLVAGNAELRRLLQFYLSQPGATNLQVGPAATVLVGANTLDVTQMAIAAQATARGTGAARPGGTSTKSGQR